MTLSSTLATYGIAVVAFLVIDLVWLGFVAPGLYQHFLGDLLLERPRWGAALVFYALFVAGLCYFAIIPALDAGSLSDALIKGALFGLFTYATWDLTSYAVLKGFPLGIVPIDIAWGMILAASVSGATYAVASRFVTSGT